MTQTIKHCNEIPAGKTYPVADLRTAPDLETLCALVDAGHPIATEDGYSVRVFRKTADNEFAFDFSVETQNLMATIYPHKATDCVKLAPLAYSNGRPLHVGDEIVVRIIGARWDKMTMTTALLEDLPTMQWRFADEAEAV